MIRTITKQPPAPLCLGEALKREDNHKNILPGVGAPSISCPVAGAGSIGHPARPWTAVVPALPGVARRSAPVAPPGTRKPGHRLGPAGPRGRKLTTSPIPVCTPEYNRLYAALYATCCFDLLLTILLDCWYLTIPVIRAAARAGVPAGTTGGAGSPPRARPVPARWFRCEGGGRSGGEQGRADTLSWCVPFSFVHFLTARHIPFRVCVAWCAGRSQRPPCYAPGFAPRPYPRPQASPP